jgi:hypothetical protein
LKRKHNEDESRRGSTPTINGVELKRTCYACPEQYDAGMNGKAVGYLRLRHGHFTVSCPNAQGEMVYEASPKGDGQFEYDERDAHINGATLAIKRWAESRS